MDVNELIKSLSQHDAEDAVEVDEITEVVIKDEFAESDDDDDDLEEDLTNALVQLEQVTKLMDKVYTSSAVHMPTELGWELEETLEEAYAFLEEFDVDPTEDTK
jgi:hypothetical protein